MSCDRHTEPTSDSTVCPLQVLVQKDEALLGKSVMVKVVEVGKHFLKGQVISDGKTCPTWSRPQETGLTTSKLRDLWWLWVGILVSVLSLLLLLPHQTYL